MTFLMKLDMGCATCHHKFEFNIEGDSGPQPVICPNCKKDHGVFELKMDKSGEIVVMYPDNPVPAHTLTYRYPESYSPPKPITLEELEKHGLKSS